MKYLHFIFLCLYCLNAIHAQEKKHVIVLYNMQFDEFNKKHGFDSTYVFVEQLHQDNLKRNDKQLMSASLFLFGRYHFIDNDYKASLKYLNQSEKLAIKRNDESVLAYIYNVKGLINSDLGDNTKALEFYLKGLKISEKNNLSKNKANILFNLGNIYSKEEDSVSYLNCIKESINIAKKEKYNDVLARGYNALARYHLTNEPKETEKFYHLGLTIAMADKNLKGQLSIHVNLSNLYLEEKKLNLVVYHLQKAEKLQAIFSDTYALFHIYYNYGSYHFKKNNFQSTIDYYLKALDISKSVNIPPDKILDLYWLLQEAYEKNNNYKSANVYYKAFIKLNDSIFTIEKRKEFKELNTKYEVEKKNLKINLLNKENQIVKSRRNQIIYVSFFIFIILVILVFLYKNKMKLEKIRSKEKQIIYENEIAIIQKNKEIGEIKAKYEGQNSERNRLSKEIHDGVGGSLAGLKLQLSQVNEDLKSTKIDFITNELTNVFKELRAISHNLNLNYLEENNFDKLLNDLIDNYLYKNSFDIKLNVFPEDTLKNIDNDLKINLYRIFQELLFNTSKYANAKKVEISITKHDDFLNIIYEDNGIGFKVNNAKKGIGLNNIKERISLFNGDFNIESKENLGVTVIINIPYHDE